MAHKTPEWDIPDGGMWYWQAFFDILRGFRAVVEGVPVRIPWTEYQAWERIRGQVVQPRDYDILARMSDAWCAAMAEEIGTARAMERQEAEKNAKTKGKG